MATEVIYSDGSVSTFGAEGGGFHAGDMALMRIRLLAAKSALEVYIKFDGKMQLTRNGAQLAIKNVIEPLTGKTYKRSMKGKIEALDDCYALIAVIEQGAVVLETEDDAS